MIKTNDTTTSRRALLAGAMTKPLKLRKREKEWCAERFMYLHKGVSRDDVEEIFKLIRKQLPRKARKAA
jgi:hypothetical protein